VFGSYVVSYERQAAEADNRGSVVAQVSYADPAVFGNSAEKRDAVLTNFVSQ
jgi:hypothetical protein